MTIGSLFNAGLRYLEWPRQRSNSEACHHCGTTAKKLDECGRCHIAKYCSQICHKAAWPKHQLVCRQTDHKPPTKELDLDEMKEEDGANDPALFTPEMCLGEEEEKALNRPSNQPLQKEGFTCPITTEPFDRPWILLEDGFTYEKPMIEYHLQQYPNQSPMIGEIPSATLLPNCAVKKWGGDVCPITKEPFIEPYYCVEDGHTYEKDAIIKWFKTNIREQLEGENFDPIGVRSPASGVSLHSLTLYPNKILFTTGRIPSNQNPEIIKIDMSEIIREAQPKNRIKPIFDARIRTLIGAYSNASDLNERNAIKKEFNELRLALGLTIRENTFDVLDLSHLDLSNMHLLGIDLKGAIIEGTDLSGSSLWNCNLSRCRLIECNMSDTQIINCCFMGETVSFFKTDLTNAEIGSDCIFEKGNTWQRINSWDDLKRELVNRGALNVERAKYLQLKNKIHDPSPKL